MGDTDNSKVEFVQELTLKELLLDAWKDRLFIISFAALFLLISIIIIYFSKPSYRAEAVISPSYIFSESFNNNGEEGNIQIVDIGISGDFLFNSYIQIIRGNSLASKIFNDKLISIYKEDCYFRFCFKNDGLNNSADLSEYLQRKIKIDPVGLTDFKKISFVHPDKEKAQYVIESIHRETNGIIRLNLEDSFSKKIDYLERKLSENIHPDHKKEIVSMIMNYEYYLMQSEVGLDVGARYVEPVYVMSRAVWPRKSFLIVFMVFIGGIVGYVFAATIRKE